MKISKELVKNLVEDILLQTGGEMSGPDVALCKLCTPSVNWVCMFTGKHGVYLSLYMIPILDYKQSLTMEKKDVLYKQFETMVWVCCLRRSFKFKQICH